MAELSTGGPDPHIALAAHLATAYDKVDAQEVFWRAGCYVAVYTVFCAEALWQALPLERALALGPIGLESWVRDHWAGMALRNERRPVKSVKKLAEHLSSLATWCSGAALGGDYGFYWESYNGEVRYVGRYATIKYLETIKQAFDLDIEQPGIMPAGAWSPRLTLSFMHPNFDELLNRGGDRPPTLATVDELAEATRFDLEEHYGEPVSNFQIEVLLCNFRQALKGRYPGRSHDSELKYRDKVKGFWINVREHDSHFFSAREALFDPRVLGERNGWDRPREVLEDTHPKYGYFWSDAFYDFNQTTDFSKPVRWA